MPGAALPHVWLSRSGKQVSTLDLVGRGRFTLLTGLGGEAWLAAAAKLAAAQALPLDAVAIGPGLNAEDVYGDWAQSRDIEENGCLLVRPDRHIAFRARVAVDHPEAALQSALEMVLARRMA
jgi:2,4-dichlorophenol 6-monooxygenase